MMVAPTAATSTVTSTFAVTALHPHFWGFPPAETTLRRPNVWRLNGAGAVFRTIHQAPIVSVDCPTPAPFPLRIRRGRLWLH